MSTSVPFSLDDTLPPDPGALSPRQRWWLALAGGILGAVIGPSGFLLQMRLSTYRATGSDLIAFPGLPGRRLEHLRALGSMGATQLFVVCGFVATVVLMPRLIRWIESRVDRPPRSYYTSAALGGVALGAVATFLVAWMLAVAALLVGVATGTSDTNASTTVAAILGGVFVFGPLVGLIAPFFFVLPIVGIGAALGIGAGAVIRRLAGGDAAP